MAPRLTKIGIAFALLVLSSLLRADSADYAAILKERDLVLSKIVADLESRRMSGGFDEERFLTAQLALHAFRRDTALTVKEKMQHQRKILSLHEKRLEYLGARERAGVQDPFELLRATDAVLAAKQLLEELRSSATKGLAEMHRDFEKHTSRDLR